MQQKNKNKSLYRGKNSGITKFKEQVREACAHISKSRIIIRKWKFKHSRPSPPPYLFRRLLAAGSVQKRWLKMAIAAVSVNCFASSEFLFPRKWLYYWAAIKSSEHIGFRLFNGNVTIVCSCDSQSKILENIHLSLVLSIVYWCRILLTQYGSFLARYTFVSKILLHLAQRFSRSICLHFQGLQHSFSKLFLLPKLCQWRKLDSGCNISQLLFFWTCIIEKIHYRTWRFGWQFFTLTAS